MIRNHHTCAGHPLRAPHRLPEEGAAVASPDGRHAPAATHPAAPAQPGTPSEGADTSPFRKETSEGAESAAHPASAATAPRTATRENTRTEPAESVANAAPAGTPPAAAKHRDDREERSGGEATARTGNGTGREPGCAGADDRTAPMCAGNGDREKTVRTGDEGISAPKPPAGAEAVRRPGENAATGPGIPGDTSGTPNNSPLDPPGMPADNEAGIPGDTSGASDNTSGTPNNSPLNTPGMPDDNEADAPGDLPDDEEPEGDALYEHLALTVDRGQAMMRLDKYLTLRMERCSRNRIQTAADSGNVLVNGRPAKSSYKVKPLDRISLVMPYPPRETEITPQDIPLDILYEDDDLLLVNKAAGMVVHPGHGNWDGTLVNALAWHLRDEPLFQRGDIRAGLVHRIDKDTSGILVVAKNERAHALLARQFFDHSITRRYLALVWGDFAEDEGTITGHIGRSVRDKLCMQVFPDGSQGKHAVTHWRVLRRFGYVTLVECRLETGRTHQIRVHMAWTGHPLFNDARYGGDRILKGTTFSKYRQFVENCFAAMPRQALHARCLGFVHPSTRQEVYFESEPPADFRTVLERWENYTAARGENDA